MARRALRQPLSSSSSEETPDPVEEALKLSRQMVADEILNAEVAKKKAETAKAVAEAAKAEAATERVESGAGKGPEDGFKFKGGIDLGEFNIMGMLTKQTDELKVLKQEAETAASQQHQVSEELRERLHAKEMEVMTTGFNAQMLTLSKMIESNANKGSFLDEYDRTKAFAAAIGMVAPGSQATDMQTTLELKKLEFDQTKEMRRLAREEKSEQRKWDLELRRLDDDRANKKVEQDRQERKDNMFASAPAAIGAAIAKGIQDSGGSDAPVTKKGKTYRAEVAPGQALEFECPGCSQPVALGPTAKSAVCANCGTMVTATRTGEAEAEE